jgi:hypothetical protein
VATIVLLHAGFILFVVIGPLMSWRWPRLVWAHLPALVWGVGSLAIGFPCPLTALEKTVRRWAGAGDYQGGFVDYYIENVIYPDRYSSVLRTAAALMVVAGYIGLHRRRRSSPVPVGG